MIFDNSTRAIQWSIILSTNGTGIIGYPCAKKKSEPGPKTLILTQNSHRLKRKKKKVVLYKRIKLCPTTLIREKDKPQNARKICKSYI